MDSITSSEFRGQSFPKSEPMLFRNSSPGCRSVGRGPSRCWCRCRPSRPVRRRDAGRNIECGFVHVLRSSARLGCATGPGHVAVAGRAFVWLARTVGAAHTVGVVGAVRAAVGLPGGFRIGVRAVGRGRARAQPLQAVAVLEVTSVVNVATRHSSGTTSQIGQAVRNDSPRRSRC